jgi:hypothetical protein
MATAAKRNATRKNVELFVRPETWITARILNRDWRVAWLREAAKDVGIEPTGTKTDLVARIATEIRKGNRRVIRRFDRCR